MSSVGSIIAIAVPILLLLLVVVIFNKRQQNSAMQRGQARKLKEFSLELAEALEFLVKVDNHKEIQSLILERLGQLNEKYLSTLSKEERSGASIIDFDELENKVKQSGKKKRLLKSDREIRYAKKQFSKILKSFGPMIKNKTVTESKVLECRRYLRIFIIEMEVDSLTAQGDVAADRSDMVTASSFYKAARKLLIDFNIQYPEKNTRIKDLAKKSKALFSDDEEEEGGSLAKELSKEEEANVDENGFSLDPSMDNKQNF